MMKKLVSVLLMLALLCGTAAIAAAYTLTLEPNGGTGTAITADVAAGGSYTLPNCTFTAPSGYEFYAWLVYNERNELIDVSDPGAEWRPGHDITFKAAWVEKSAPTYTVTFDANGGTGKIDSGTTRGGMPIMLPPAKVFTAPAGKVFKNWDISGWEYREAGIVENVQSDLKVIAEWMTEGATLYNVTFDKGNGSGTMPVATVEAGEWYALPECTFTAPSGYEFYAWEYYSNGTLIDVTDPGLEWEINRNMTFKAAWVEKNAPTYTLTFDANGGTGEAGSVTTRRGMAIMLPPDKVFTAPVGKVFKCWEINGTEYRSAGMVENVQSDLTVKAIWADCEHSKDKFVSTTNSTKTYTSTAEGHVGSYTVTTTYHCNKCGWDIPEVETVTEEQAKHSFSGSTCTVCKYTCSAHSYENGVCAICGHTCDHAGAKHNGTGTSKLKSAVDHRDGTHTRTFEVWHNYECPTCKYVYEKYIEMGTATEPHEYGENGTCHVCGAKPACETHINISEVKVTDGEKTYPEMGIDYTYHTAVFERTTLYDCHDCGWQFSKTQTVMESPEKHNYDEGVCTICANACKHEYDEGAMFCKHCGTQAPTRVEQKSVEEALEEMKPEVKEALADAGLDTAEKITEKLTEAVPAAVYVEEQIQVIDVALEIQVVNEKGNPEWVEVTEENFPTEGLEVTFDPPAGTNVNDYNFVVVHMFTSPDKAGQVEVLTPTVRDGKLVVKFTSLSPVSISWKAKPQAAASLPQTGDDSMLLLWAALLTISTTVLVMKKRSRA